MGREVMRREEVGREVVGREEAGRKVMRRKGMGRKLTWLIQGSMTVEASFIVPATVLLTALLIVMCFYVHNRNWYLAAASEVCLAGNSRYDREVDAQGIAERKAEERVKSQVMPASRPAIAVTCGKRGTSISFSGQRFSAFQDIFHLSVSADVDKVTPVGELRTARMVRKSIRR